MHRRRRVGEADVGLPGRDELRRRARTPPFLDRHVDAGLVVESERLRLLKDRARGLGRQYARPLQLLLEECPIARMPPEALAFIYPSRYCESDRLRRFAAREFGHLRPGYWRVQAILDWVKEQLKKYSNDED